MYLRYNRSLLIIHPAALHYVAIIIHTIRITVSDIAM